MSEERRFPIQGEWNDRLHKHLPPITVPWSVAEAAYAVYARKFGDMQSLETLASRGGFGREEILLLLDGGDKL